MVNYALNTFDIHVYLQTFFEYLEEMFKNCVLRSIY